nr:hypothetical protein [Tanacetum cinerariifolium]
YFEQYEAMEEDEAESSVKHTRRYIARDRELAEDKLRRDYFGNENTPPVYPKEYFCRRPRVLVLAGVSGESDCRSGWSSGEEGRVGR